VPVESHCRETLSGLLDEHSERAGLPRRGN
jgi:hypothetical protein